jgi:hypothetical protein
VSLATLETLRQTYAMLEQKRVALKYGLPQYIGFTNAESKATSTVAAAPAMVTATEGSSSKAGQNASDELRKITKVAVVQKGFIPADPNSRRYQAF